MRRKQQFDEVMIVNPSQGRTNSDQRVRLMRFHNTIPPEVQGFAEPDPYGYYAEPEPYGYYAEPETYGHYAEVDPAMGYYGEVNSTYGYYSEVDPALSYYGEVDPTYGYYGEVDPAMGYYSEVEPAYGYYAQAPEFAGVGYGYGEPQPGGEPVGYFAEEQPVGYYGEDPNQPMGYYSQAPEMVGYGEPEFAEEYPGVGYYGEPDYAGYVRETSSAFNPGCPLPTNVNGFDEGEFAGYARPASVNPSCDQITPQPGSAPSTPDTFKPLW
jgi:hypothetical protein